MRKPERFECFRESLAVIVGRANGKVSFFNPDTGRGLRFISKDYGTSFFIEVPNRLNEFLSESEISSLRNLDFEKNKTVYTFKFLRNFLDVDVSEATVLAHEFESLREIGSSGSDFSGNPKIDNDFLRALEEKISDEMDDRGIERDYILRRECRPYDAVEFTDKIFRDVYSFPEGYEVSANLVMGTDSCFLCGRTILPNDSGIQEITLERAKELGAEDSEIEKEIDKQFSLYELLHHEEPEGEIRETREKMKEKKKIYPRLCSACRNFLSFHPTSAGGNLTEDILSRLKKVFGWIR